MSNSWETWHDLISEAMECRGEDWGDVVAHTFTDGQQHVRFDSSWGSPEGCPFTVWTQKWVYFPVCYDGEESVSSAPRDPCDHKCGHVGNW